MVCLHKQSKMFLAATTALLLGTVGIMADESRVSFAVNIMVGGRYDDLRMCVGSPAGVKGGPIADIMLVTRYHFDERNAVGLKLPVFRPVLFGIAFKMLQFEPELTYERIVSKGDDVSFVVGPGIGASFHYGPDYKTSKDAENPDRFFAAGPVLSCLLGLDIHPNSSLPRIIGLRPFYIPLFAQNRETGTVVGASVEGHLGFADIE